MDSSSESNDIDPVAIIWKIIGVHGTVSQRLYVTVGFGLMLFKYLVEMLTVRAFTGLFFSPIQFCIPSIALREPIFNAAPAWLPWAMALWSIPFLWIAVSMTCRRAVDAGRSPWACVWIFLPVVNLMAMLFFALHPSDRNLVARKEIEQRTGVVLDDPQEVTSKIFAACAGLFVGTLFSLCLVLISIYTMHNYGGSLFIGMPFVAGAAAAFVFNQPTLKGAWSSCLIGALCVILGEAVLLVFAFEGVICLVMAAPLMIPVGGLGGLLGYFLASTILNQSRMMLGSVALVMPLLNVIEVQLKSYKEYVVESSVVIDASPDEVWENVIDFPDIETPAAWYFRLGVASPLRANIYGSGVGAVRHCEFTTGSFIEPITVWELPNRLAFDVVDQPDPLVELTPYASIHPPHLQHSFLSRRGEFELVQLSDGKTKLIGRTWYSLDMGPRIYWRIWTDEIIHRVHLRVLDHIRETTEAH